MPDATRPIVDLSASCACGAVRVTVKGPVYAMLLCSCLDCQKATGTGHSAVASVDASSVSVSGETRAFSRPADSGATFTRHFCPGCGTPLHGQSSRLERNLLLPVGLFGDESDWFRPARLIFARSHHEWDSIAAELSRHDTYPARS